MICCGGSHGVHKTEKRNDPCCGLVASCPGGKTGRVFRQAMVIDAGGKSRGKFTAKEYANSNSGNVINRYLKMIITEVCTTSAILAIVPRDCSRLNRNNRGFGGFSIETPGASRRLKEAAWCPAGSLFNELSQREVLGRGKRGRHLGKTYLNRSLPDVLLPATGGGLPTVPFVESTGWSTGVRYPLV